MSDEFFLSLTSESLASEIDRATRSVLYVAPGIWANPADALVSVARRISPEMIAICMDVSEPVFRKGFGDFDSVEKLRAANISINSVPGIRTGILVVDDTGYMFTPNTQLVEAENLDSDAAPNAMRLLPEQVSVVRARMFPAGREIAIRSACTQAERDQIEEQTIEVVTKDVSEEDITSIKEGLKEAPPVDFDKSRMVSVYSPYLQYVELTLTGAAIHRKKIRIPKAIQGLQGSEDFKRRLKTTFDLIERDSQVSSELLDSGFEHLDFEFKRIRERFTRSLGKEFGRSRILLKSSKPMFQEEIEEFKRSLGEFKDSLKQSLQEQIDKSKGLIKEYYVPILVNDFPRKLEARWEFYKSRRNSLTQTQVICDWIDEELEKCFPDVESLIEGIEVSVVFKDITYEDLNRDDFFEKVKVEFPSVDWDKPYNEFKAQRVRPSYDREDPP